MKELKGGTITTLIIIAVVLVYIINFKRKHPGVSVIEAGRSEIASLIGSDVEDKPYKELVITKERSKTLYLRDKSIGVGELNFDVAIVEENVPFTYHYNGGEGNGGWDYHVPARLDWVKKELWGGKEWQPKSFRNVYSVSFSIDENSPVGIANLQYTLTK